MINADITDLEVQETRFPIRVEDFSIRRVQVARARMVARGAEPASMAIPA